METIGYNINDSYPEPIVSICKRLGQRLPVDNIMGHSLSYYLHLPGTLQDIKNKLNLTISQSSFNKFKEVFEEYSSMIFTNTDLEVFVIDWWINCKPLGANAANYFRLELMRKSKEERKKFLFYDYSVWLRKKYNNDHKSNKYLTYKKLSGKYIHRNWIYPKESSFEDFQKFIHKYDQFFIKPVDGSQGKNAGIENLLFEDEHTLYKYYIKNKFLLEERLTQNPLLENIHDKSLNTIRVWTFKHKITGACLRMGVNSSHVDNFEHGGIGSSIDLSTGKLIYPAVNSFGERFEHHPNSNINLMNITIPDWNEVKKVVTNASHLFSEQHLGWDICLNNQIEIVEVNFKPGMDLLQSGDMIGKKYLYQEK